MLPLSILDGDLSEMAFFGQQQSNTISFMQILILFFSIHSLTSLHFAIHFQQSVPAWMLDLWEWKLLLLYVTNLVHWSWKFLLMRVWWTDQCMLNDSLLDVGQLLQLPFSEQKMCFGACACCRAIKQYICISTYGFAIILWSTQMQWWWVDGGTISKVNSVSNDNVVCKRVGWAAHDLIRWGVRTRQFFLLFLFFSPFLLSQVAGQNR